MTMDIRIIRSARRRKTIQARKVKGTLEILAPAALSDEQLQPHISNLIKRLNHQDQLAHIDEAQLHQRAQHLNHTYFEGKLRWHHIQWTHRQKKSFGSCTPATGTIRLSARLATMPSFVLDYVIMHELAHLLEPNHSPRFWGWVNRYPKTERAIGYLMAIGLDEDDTS